MNSPIYFRPVIPLLISLIFGILLGSGYPGFEFWTGMILAVCAVCIGRFIYHGRSGAVFPILLFAALGYLSIAPWVQPKYPANHIIHFAGSNRWYIAGKIEGQPQYTENRIRLILRVSSLADEHRSLAVSGKVRVTVAGFLPQIAAGDELRLKSRIRLITNFRNPGGFDYRKYMAFKGVWATAYVRGDRLTVIHRHRAAGFSGMIRNARNRFSDLIRISADGQAGAVFKALIIGDRTQISPELRESFNRAGVGHLLAISGLHIGIVATVAFLFFQGLMVRFKMLLWRAWTRKAAALLSLLPVLLYGVIAGLSPSTLRAVIMVSVFLLTFLFERDQDPFNTLSLAALLILVADPPSLFSISFQLSFTAVLSIMYGLAWNQNLRKRQKPVREDNWYLRVKRKLIAFFLISLFAICGSLPLVAYYFNQVSLVGLAANFIAVPLIGFITVPLGLVALFTLPLSINVAAWCIQAGTFVLSSGMDAINFFADLPFAAVKTVTPSVLEILCYYILGWTLLNLRRAGSGDEKTPPDTAGEVKQHFAGRADLSPTFPPYNESISANRLSRLKINDFRPAKLAGITLVAVLLTLAMDTGYWLYQRFWHRDLRVTVLDVGHGSASLLELPGGHTILIDGGGFSDNSAFDVGRRIIAPFLWRKKIRTVDTLILSHPESDHLNGLIYIARHFNVKNAWTNSQSRNSSGYEQFMKVIRRKNILLPAFETLPRRFHIGGVEIDILYPPPDYLKLRKTQKWRNTNNNSLVVRASYNFISFLFPGDIMAEAEKELVDLAGSQLPCTVMVAPHHGSKSSSSNIFLKAVNPDVVVISSSRSDRFKLPHFSVLKRYENRGCKIWRTRFNGAIYLSTDGRHLDVTGTEEFGS
jgi:competence protein ComEC